MRVLEESVTLVIAGAWNPAILSPNWIAEKAMQRQVGADFQVQVAFPVANLNFNAVRPRLEFEGISVCAEPHAVTFSLSYEDEAGANLGVATAAKVLELLPHTPVSGFGFNFGFIFNEPSQELLETFGGTNFLVADIPDDNALLVRQEWGGTVQSHGRLVNVSAKYEANKVLFNLNIHTEVPNATEAAKGLQTDNLFASMKEIASGIVRRFEQQGAAI